MLSSMLSYVEPTVPVLENQIVKNVNYNLVEHYKKILINTFDGKWYLCSTDILSELAENSIVSFTYIKVADMYTIKSIIVHTDDIIYNLEDYKLLHPTTGTNCTKLITLFFKIEKVQLNMVNQNLYTLEKMLYDTDRELVDYQQEYTDLLEEYKNIIATCNNIFD